MASLFFFKPTPPTPLFFLLAVTPERYSQIKSIFHAVLERPIPQRAAYLNYLCPNDPGLKAEVEELLNSDESSATFLETPAMTPVAQLLDVPATFEALPRHIGPYQILSILGSGGMGTVCLAVRADDHYKKRVAIKLIRQGLESDTIVERFRRERQIVASLEHPNIAQLLDGGATPEGRPYLVMEYVEGIPIDEYCDKHKLPVAERIKLFRTVCAAVDYAHKNLVVHRDIKPGNILVRQDGTVKLLDFGIAKLLTPEGVPKDFTRTATSMRLMTPQYASPEQMMGDTITTASDVYLLGIVLYELLTGHRPFQAKEGTSIEVARVIAQPEPDKPSTAISRVVEAVEYDGTRRVTHSPQIVSLTRDGSPKKLRQNLEGDLDAIVLKALKRKPQERYGSAEQLSEDLRRHLELEPVSARPRTTGYLIAKFAAKHRSISVATAAVLGILLLAIATTTWQARRASEQRTIAERRFSEVRKVANSFLFEVHDAIAPLPGTTPARKLLVGKALEYLNGLSQEDTNDSSLQAELATAYQRVGDLQGNPNSANLGDTAGAFKSYRKALAIREALATKDATLKPALAETNAALGDMMATFGSPAAALDYYRRALSLCEEAQVKGALFIDSLHNVAALLPLMGKSAEALTLSQKANDLAKATGDKRVQSISLARLGETRERTGDLSAALAAFQQALAFRQQIYASDPSNLRARRDLSFLQEDLGVVLEKLGKHSEAAGSFRRSIAIRQELAALDPMNMQAQRDLALAYLKEASSDNTRKAATIFQSIATRDPANLLARRDLALAYDQIGSQHAAQGAWIPAKENYRKLVLASKDWLAQSSDNLFASQMLAMAHLKMGEAQAASGDKPAATQSIQTAATLFETLHHQDKDNAEFTRGLAITWYAFGRSLSDSSQCAEAKVLLEKSAALVEDLQKKNKLQAVDAKLPAEITSAMQTCKH